ncbi:MAG: aminoacyl-tRNA hydrolase [Spirochaetia bacterium]|jgi:PTH1 family peptidyl-tRNA hydrolase|nr:aminoacyl-tRNA hydrolase [Spirochaetia bacterium]
MVKLLIFLGNPGKTYEKSRHNVGWLFCDHLYPSVQWSQKFHSLVATEGLYKLLKPQTFMNESGKAVRACSDFFNFPSEELLVVHDDLELPFGTIRLQKGGGLGGHNGLKSIKSHLGSDAFLRLRFGIGRPQRGSVASYVLLPFSKEEAPLLSLLFDRAENLLRGDVSALPVTNTLV